MNKHFTAPLGISLLWLLVIDFTTITSHNFRHDLDSQIMFWKHAHFDDSAEKFTFAIFSDPTGGERGRIFPNGGENLKVEPSKA